MAQVHTLLAQVLTLFGAGEVFDGVPAPRIGLLRPPLAQVPTLFPHLRQEQRVPAPRTLGTCAKIIGDLRQQCHSRLIFVIPGLTRNLPTITV